MIWVIAAVIGVGALIWLRCQLMKPCEGHSKTCPACRREVVVFHTADFDSVTISHEPPECSWFEQNMRLNGNKVMKND